MQWRFVQLIFTAVFGLEISFSWHSTKDSGTQQRRRLPVFCPSDNVSSSVAMLTDSARGKLNSTQFWRHKVFVLDHCQEYLYVSNDADLVKPPSSIHNLSNLEFVPFQRLFPL